MDNKFNVSLEAARLLKEKGYDKHVRTFYNEEGLLLEMDCYYNFESLIKEDFYNNRSTAPSKAEAIDWLESKGILIATYFTYNRKWFCTIASLDRGEIVSTLDLPTRLEAEEAAIIKALELL